MSSISPDAVRAEIVENSIVVGNPVKTAAKLRGLASLPIYADTNGNLAVAAYPFAVPIAPTNVTDGVLDLSSTPNGNIMTQTLVAAASATTFTSAGFFRLTVVSANDAIMSSGAYYVQLGTLT